MINYFRFFLILCVSCSMFGQSNTPLFDSVLAKRLNADERGMKMYVLAILKTGTNTTKDQKVLDSLFTGHMNNINRLAKENKLVVAGPFEKNLLNYRGIFVLNVSSREEALKLCQTDPAVQAKLFDLELLEWYCSAALQEVGRIHEHLQKNIQN